MFLKLFRNRENRETESKEIYLSFKLKLIYDCDINPFQNTIQKYKYSGVLRQFFGFKIRDTFEHGTSQLYCVGFVKQP